jgi:hypothetical protein
MIKNFLFVLNRFKTSSILNILGLSVAFATFIIIMMQIDYDRNFDKCHENSDRIYRLEVETEDLDKWAVLPRPFADILFQSSPQIEEGTIMSILREESIVTIEKKGNNVEYKEKTIPVYPSFSKVFKLNLLEGSDTALEEPNTALIPQSIAQKFFGDEPASGKQMELSGKTLTIGGVLSGFYPAIYITSFPPAFALKGSFGLSVGGRILRNTLIGIQFIASLVLIISAGFMYLQNRHLQKMPVGYNKNQVIITDVNDKLREKFDVFKNELTTFQEIENVSYSQFIMGTENQYMIWGEWNKHKKERRVCKKVNF